MKIIAASAGTVVCQMNKYELESLVGYEIDPNAIFNFPGREVDIQEIFNEYSRLLTIQEELDVCNNTIRMASESLERIFNKIKSRRE